jgi:hypothetical protein
MHNYLPCKTFTLWRDFCVRASSAYFLPLCNCSGSFLQGAAMDPIELPVKKEGVTMFFMKQACISSGSRHLWITFAGLVLSVTLWSSTASGITAAPTATGFGVDDNNTSTLIPFGAQYITASGFLNNAIANSAFNNANWIFQFVNGTTTPFIPPGDLTVNTYSAWVVTNDPVADPGGTLRNRPVNGADGGGANFALTYTPRAASTDPGAASIHFLQIFRESLNGQAATFNLDNGQAGTPFYDPGFISNIGANSSWMFDISYDCENGLTGETQNNQPTCMGGMDEVLLSSALDFQVFVAVDNLADGVHTVNLYGGEAWGYRYSNTDVPEPSTFTLFVAGLVGLLGYGWRHSRIRIAVPRQPPGGHVRGRAIMGRGPRRGRTLPEGVHVD